MIIRTTIFLTSFIGCLCGFTQNLDSLEQVLEVSENYEDQIELHEQLSNSYFNQGNYSLVLFHRQQILDLKLNYNDTLQIGRELANIARTHYFMRTDSLSNTRALRYFRLALNTSLSKLDSIGLMAAYRGIGTIHGEGQNGRNFTEQGLDSCFIYLGKALALAEIIQDSVSQSNLLSIIGSYRIARGEMESKKFETPQSKKELNLAEIDFEKAFSIANSINDWESKAFALRKLSAINYHKREKKPALKYIHKALEIYQKHEQLDGQLNAYSMLAHIYRDMHSAEDYLTLDSIHRIYQSISDQLYNNKTAQALIEVETKYETEKKEQQIKTLAAESQLQASKIAQSRTLIIAITIIGLLLILTLLLIGNRKQYKLKIKHATEKERIQKNRFKAVIEAEEKERKRIAQELHDGLGQLLSTARLSVSSLDENEENDQVIHSLKMIDLAVGETRNISHNLMPNALTSTGLKEAILDLGRKINKSETLKVELDIDDLPEFIEAHSISIYRIVQESLNNILKYAEAKNIFIKGWVDSQIHLEIRDDGKGFDTNEIEKSDGIGWKNIQSRLSLLGGDYTVFSKLGEGTTLKLNLSFDESSKASTG